MSSITLTPLLYEAVLRYVSESDGPFSFTKTKVGVNNHVFVVKSSKLPESFVLRMYNNGNNKEKVICEHEVLRQLSQVKLGFQVPNSIELIDDNNEGSRLKHNIAFLSNGSCVSAFKFIVGSCPYLSCCFTIGATLGELTLALATIDKTLINTTRHPFYDIFYSHELISRDVFFNCLSDPVFSSHQNSLNFLVAELHQLETKSLHQLSLPKQIIHGDLQYENVLCDQGVVTAVLDFEFVTFDYRVMDLAICLSKYVGENDPFQYIEPCLQGYSHHVTLTPQEIEFLPTCIIVRVVWSLVYFMGRIVAKEEVPATLCNRLENYCQRVRWCHANTLLLQAMLKTCQSVSSHRSNF